MGSFCQGCPRELFLLWLLLAKKDCQKAERDAISDLNLNISTASLLDVCTHRLDFLKLSRSEEYFRDQRILSKKILKSFDNIPISSITSKMASDLFLDEIKRCREAGFGNMRPNELPKTISTVCI